MRSRPRRSWTSPDLPGSPNAWHGAPYDAQEGRGRGGRPGTARAATRGGPLGPRGPEPHVPGTGSRGGAGGARGRCGGADDRVVLRRHAGYRPGGAGDSRGGRRPPGGPVPRVRVATHRPGRPRSLPLAHLRPEPAIPDRRACARGPVPHASSRSDTVHGIHPGGRWARDQRRGGEPDAPVTGGQAGARGRARDGRPAHRHAGDLPGRGQRGAASRGRGRDSRVSRRGAGPDPVRRRRHSDAGAGARGAGRWRGLRGRGHGGGGARGPPPGAGARRHPVTPAEQARAGLAELAALATRVAEQQGDAIAALVEVYVGTLRAGGTLLFAGNGGSAADAQHIATEYVVRYSHNRRPLPAIALTTDTSLLTAGANDLGFDEIFARQVEALARPGDVLVLHSTSGESPNLVRAAQAAKMKGVTVVALLGKSGGALKDLADHSLVVPSDDTSHIQELHLAVEHILCGMVERALGL